MGTREKFITRQHKEARETLDWLLKIQADLTERIGARPDDAKLKEWLGEAELGVRALEPIVADFDREGVDPEELIGYAQTIEDWERRTADLAKRIG